MRAGDIFRTIYDHWALYVGDEYVIHVTDEGASSVLASSSSVCAGKAKVKKQLLKEVVGNSKWRVNNKYDRSRTPRPVEEIIRRAEQWIGKEVTYNVFNKNCEHFVTKLRYGEALCEQVQDAAYDGVTAAALGIVAGVATVVANAFLRR
ncbi:phospholipase A and acyltransferase 1-like [Onychostruthus taczanowskii]|uniref:phospholipase A and acyltransferase 1-like n=1 Tax=Onychostruthus taczanowskii TaxID=356909 RepID=UPI001B80CFA6|nr:phospholipase A and acyltransferase 1-like [Onychostruthus taczanowskii]